MKDTRTAKVIDPDEVTVPLESLKDISKEQVKGLKKNMQTVADADVSDFNPKEVRKLLEDHVVNEIGAKGKYLTEKLFELCDGVYMIDSITPTPGGNNIKYYRVPPNLAAIQYSLDRVLGRPTQKQITASFSLANLLKDDGPSDDETIEERPSLLHREDMEVDPATDKEGT